MYADDVAIAEVSYHPKFVRFKDEGSDSILVSIEDIMGFEVLDDRRVDKEESGNGEKQV